MELIKNIFFNTDKLTPNNKIKISYSGKLFQEKSKKIFIRYGFGTEWEELLEKEMTLSELGFQTEIELIDSTTFNLCFKNENDEWDNNNGDNYVFKIEHPETALVVTNLDDFGLISTKKLRKSYIISKKIRIAIYKLIISIPKLVSGNYKRKKDNLTNI